MLPLSPRPPSQREGGDYKLVLPGGFAPGTPAAVPVRHWRWAGRWRPAGGLAPGGADAAGGGGIPGGGLTGWLPVCPALSLLFCPHPPSPLPLRGRGSPKVYFAGGFAPRHPCGCACAALDVGREVAIPRWGLTGWLSVCPAFCLLCCPIPPTPFPAGRGDYKLILPGASPPAPLRLCLRGTGGGREVAIPRRGLNRMVAGLPCL